MKNKHHTAKWMLATTLALTTLGTGAGESAMAQHDDNSLIPVREYGTKIQADIRWDSTTRKVVVSKRGQSLEFQVGADHVQINGASVPLSSPVRVVNGQSMLPHHVLHQAFGTVLRPVSSTLDSFQPQPVENGSQAEYDLQVKMDEQAQFTAKAQVTVTNLSSDEWRDLVFYFLPNVFTAENKPDSMDDSADVGIDQVLVNGVKTDYRLLYDRLTIPLAAEMQPNDKVTVEVTYHFLLPVGGFRFYQTPDNYYLAQWYPMLATYQNGDWNQEPYLTETESYHTAHSDFKVSYDLPKGYQLFSTSDQDPVAGTTSGVVEAKQVKEVFLTISKGMRVSSKKVNGIEIRVAGRKQLQAELDAALDVAGEAVEYFSEKMGPYPFKQLDVILDDQEEGGMEYPGIVTVMPRGIATTKQATIHEIAHQWFYGMVSSDPYFEGWLDEGMTTLATSMFMYDVGHFSEVESFWYPRRFLTRIGSDQKPVNLPISYYSSREIGPYLYGQPAVKMWDLFSRYAGTDTGWDYLNEYFARYAYKQVNTSEFVRFAQAYFGLTDDSYFRDWLELE